MATGDNSGGIKASAAGLDFNSKKGINLANGTAATDGVALGQVTDAINFLNQDPASAVDVQIDDFESSSAVIVANGTTFGRVGFRGGSTNVNGVTHVTTNTDATHIGVLQLARGTTATNGAAIALAPAGTVFPIVLGSGQSDVQDWIVRVPVLSDGTNTFGIRFGLTDSPIGSATNGAYIEYLHTASVNWRGISITSSTPTVASGGSTVGVTAGTWVHLRRTWDGTTLTFFVDGVSIGSTTTVPTGVNLCEFAQILGVAGATDRTVLIDRYSRVRKFTARAA